VILVATVVTGIGIALFALSVLIVALHIGTIALAISKLRRSRAPLSASVFGPAPTEPVSLIVPVTRAGARELECLRTCLALDHPTYEVILCIVDGDDAARALIEPLLAQPSAATIRLVTSTSGTGRNPKLDNLAAGIRAASNDWLVLVDDNVIVPPDLVARLASCWSAGTGAVSSPPIGVDARSFAAEVEAGFLNTFQARWLLALDVIGRGFAHGKTILLRRAVLDQIGGIDALQHPTAEDAALTLALQRNGLAVRIVDRPVMHPLGPRRFAPVWARQLRWAQLRREAFPATYGVEVFGSALVVAVLAATGASLCGSSAIPAALCILLVWYGLEAALARSAGWPLTRVSLFAWVTRDVMIVLLWLLAWVRKDYVWRGNAIDMRLSNDTSTKQR
jgi:ceramide glucosyltransferase